MTALDRLPRVLLIEATLAAVAILGGVLPFALTWTMSLRLPSYLSPIGWFAFASLGCLWIMLLAHAAVDGWKVMAGRVGLDATDPWESIQIAFRIVESLGVLLPPVLIVWFGRSFGRSPPPAPAAVGTLFLVVGSFAAVAVVVVGHAGWQLAAGPPTRNDW